MSAILQIKTRECSQCS